MVKITKTEVSGWEAAIRGMRNPHDSWEKSDSVLCKGSDGFEDCKTNASGTCPRHSDFSHDIFCIGKNDHELMMTLVKAGSDHRKFMRSIIVSADITAPFYWWKEFDTYKVGTVSNSCSTMHTIHTKEFSLDDFSIEHLYECDSQYYLYVVEAVAEALNTARNHFNETKEKLYWDVMIQLLPSSYNQMRTITFSYEVLRNMYHARKNHKLDEWHTFCEWIESLPYSELITEKGATK